MTRAEAYAEGWHSGRQYAEQDIRDHSITPPHKPWRLVAYMSDSSRAEQLGYMRGYRDTIARYEAGTLTWEMFENAPVNR